MYDHFNEIVVYLYRILLGFGLLINDGGSFGREAHLLDKAGESNNEAQTEERNRSQDDHYMIAEK